MSGGVFDQGFAAVRMSWKISDGKDGFDFVEEILKRDEIQTSVHIMNFSIFYLRNLDLAWCKNGRSYAAWEQC